MGASLEDYRIMYAKHGAIFDVECGNVNWPDYAIYSNVVMIRVKVGWIQTTKMTFGNMS